MPDAKHIWKYLKFRFIEPFLRLMVKCVFKQMKHACHAKEISTSKFANCRYKLKKNSTK